MVLGASVRPPRSDEFYRYLDEVRRAQRSYQKSGHARVPQRVAICVRAEGSAHSIDGCWQPDAGRRYELLKSAAPLTNREFRRLLSQAIASESDRKILKSLKLLQFESEFASTDPHPDFFPTIAGAWANYRMDLIDKSVGSPRGISDPQRKSARSRTLSNLAACYLLMRVDEGCASSDTVLPLVKAALAYPPPL